MGLGGLPTGRGGNIKEYRRRGYLVLGNSQKKITKKKKKMGALQTPPRGGAGSCAYLEARKSCSSLGKRPFAPREVPGEDAGGRDPRPVKRVQAKMPSTSSRRWPTPVAKIVEKKKKKME